MYSSEATNLTHEPLAACRLTAEQKERLTDVLDRYLRSLEDGSPLDPELLVREHPDLAEPLREYLRRLDELHGAATGLVQDRVAGRSESSAPVGETKRLGDFFLGRELGRGGMGIVYEAHQISLDRRVALKVLPFAAVLDPKQIARFKTEAQAAAQILHPNIVPVFAIGVERGVHFYAMQLIDGQPLDRAIAEVRERSNRQSRPIRLQENLIRLSEQDLSPTEFAGDDLVDSRPEATGRSLLSSRGHTSQEYFETIARLGVQAAEALHAAHEHGIVHRDVKPSNLLLDGDGKLWVTDFGLARCQRDAALSKTGDIVGTMRYMSPEQAAGKTSLIDQRTDVYSLGVTLYELLTLRPLISEGDSGLVRRLDVPEPTPVRKLNANVPAALENVILKAIARAREDRYMTAQDLAADLRRFLDGKPTVAKPPTVVERCAKWAARHRHAVAATVGVAFLACLGFALSTLLIAREKLRTEQNYERAERNLREAQQAVDRFGSQFAERLVEVPGAAHVRRAMLQESLAYYQRFAEQAAGDPFLQSDVALTHSKIGTLADQMGATRDAIAAHDKAIRLFEKLAADEPHSFVHPRRLALCLNNLALTMQRVGRVDEAKRLFQRAIALQSDLARRTSEQAHRDEWAITSANLGLLLSESGEKNSAVQAFREAIRLQEELVAATPNDAELRRRLATTYNNLGAVDASIQDEAGESCYASALAHLQHAMTLEPDDRQSASSLATTYSNLGAWRSRQKDFGTAAEAYEKALELQRALIQSDPYHNGYRRDLAITCNNHGLAQSRLGNPAPAEQAFRESLKIHETLVSLDAQDVALRSSCGGVYNNLGIVLEEQNRLADAVEAYDRAIAKQGMALERAPTVSRYRLFQSRHYVNLGRVLRRMGHGEQAVETALRRRELWRNEPQRLFAVAEELAMATECVPDPDRVVALVIDTLNRATAAGGQMPPGFLDREALAPLRSRIESDARDQPRLAGVHQFQKVNSGE